MAGVNLDRRLQTAVHSDQALYDLLKITTDNYPNKHKLEILQTRHEWPVMNQIFKNHREQISSGSEVTESVMLDADGNAKFVEPYETDETSVPNTMATLSMPMKLCQVSWNTEKTELLRNRAPDKMIDLVEKKRAEADYSVANLLEVRGFRTPNSTSDKKNPYGFPYYLKPITTAQVAAGTWGHQGANPNIGTIPGGAAGNTGDFGNCLGIDSSDATYALWRSYNDVWAHNGTLYDDMDDDDIVKITRMLRHLKFRVPMNAKQFQDDVAVNFALYAGELLIEKAEKIARGNNDSLGADLGMYAGSVVVKGTPIQWIEEMDYWCHGSGLPVATYPSQTLMAVNLEQYFPYVMEGDYFAESGPFIEAQRHRVAIYYEDLQFNFWCHNRRKCGGRIDSQP